MSPILTSLLCKATIPELPPSVNHIWHQGKGRTYKPKPVVEWQRNASLLIAQGKKIAEPYPNQVALFMTLYVKNRRRMDIDNRIKCLQDCIAPAGIVNDDSQVWLIEIGRLQDTQGLGERVEIEIWSINDTHTFMDALRQRWFCIDGDNQVDIIKAEVPPITKKKDRKTTPIVKTKVAAKVKKAPVSPPKSVKTTMKKKVD